MCFTSFKLPAGGGGGGGGLLLGGGSWVRLWVIPPHPAKTPARTNMSTQAPLYIAEFSMKVAAGALSAFRWRPGVYKLVRTKLLLVRPSVVSSCQIRIELCFRPSHERFCRSLP